MVMRGLDPRIHVFCRLFTTWMAVTSTAMTKEMTSGLGLF
jgi:hypothetical protein